MKRDLLKSTVTISGKDGFFAVHSTAPKKRERTHKLAQVCEITSSGVDAKLDEDGVTTYSLKRCVKAEYLPGDPAFLRIATAKAKTKGSKEKYVELSGNQQDLGSVFSTLL